MYEQNTSMVAANEQNKFLLPAMVEGDFSRDEIAEDADGLQMMSFQRVKIPAGGALQFEVPTEDPDNPDYTRTLEGIILYNHSAYTLWPEGSEYDEDTKPLCSSVDGKTGIGVAGLIPPENKFAAEVPLTTQELRKMDGEQVFCLDMNEEVRVVARKKGFIQVTNDKEIHRITGLTLYRHRPSWCQ